MSIVLDNQWALRPIQWLPFCYLCGRTVEDGEATNRDHVPPSAIFAVADRNFPLILRTHTTCNGDRSGEDAIIGQLVSVLHGSSPTPEPYDQEWRRGALKTARSVWERSVWT
jgi:hypothetical protein